MLRILIAIIEMLFGIESEPEAPPTRRPARRPAGPAGPQRTGGTESKDSEKPTTIEDIFKRLLGLEDEPPPARPVRTQPQQQQPAARPQPARRPQPAPMPVSRREARPAPARLPTEEVPAPATVPGNNARSFARRLRGNPAAAREAFVFSEIFGPPLADRRPGSGRP